MPRPTRAGALHQEDRTLSEPGATGRSSQRSQRSQRSQPSETSDWVGATYDRISQPHADMGAPALERLELSGDERVLDAGCGSGRLTERLMERLPRGSAIALDGSASMLKEARHRLQRFGGRVTYVHANLADPPLPVEGQVDAIMSTATFHWVLDHDDLFAGLAQVLRPGGRLSAQCGGEGNATAMIEAARAEGLETAGSFHMASVEATTRRLKAAGFRDIEAWLVPETISFDSRDDLLEYIVTPYLRPATGLPDAELYTIAEAMADRVGVMAIDYVRLNITARKQ